MSQPNPAMQSYDRLASIYDRRWRSYEDATLRATLAALTCQGSERLLDVACGTGELERLLLPRWPQLQIVGCDLSAGMLQQAMRKEIGQQVRWIQAEAGKLPLEEGIFDWVVCASSVHYFRQPAAALGEMRRLLRPNGSLVLVDWCDDYLTCKLCGWWLRWTDAALNRIYTMRECKTLLEEAGFHIVDCRRFRVGWLWGLMQFVCRRS